MGWSNTWEPDADIVVAPVETPEEQQLVMECKKRYGICQDWEAEARVRFDYDYKFANGDTHNKYQWDSTLVENRELEDRPVLTVNKTQQHNLMVINDAKQNKPGVRIRPVSDEATFEAAEMFQELVYHTEYISNATTVYDSATTFQVEAGIGYWRIVTDWVDNNSFDQEAYIRHIKDPRSVYADPDINEVDGSDMRFAIVFEDMPKEIFKEKHPKFASIAGMNVLGNGSTNDGWVTREIVRVADYYKKEEKPDKLITWTNPDSRTQVLKKKSEFTDQEKLMYAALKKEKTAHAQWMFRERDIITNDITIYKIAGDRIVDRKPWLGKYIPIVRLVGTETVIDGILDRKGHTRALINAQQIYNYNTSANVEYGALQTKAPWVAATKAVEGYEEYYKTANTDNHGYLPYNHMDDDGNAIPPPSRPQPPQPGTAYTEGMKIAQNEMMMASGQWQAQLGENENAKSGVAINARQRQGDRATYHFLDNQATAIRLTGKILIDLYPKIYDTKRLKQIVNRQGQKMNIQIDPKFPQSFQKLPNANPDQDQSKQVEQYIFNPNVGTYDVQADTGPNYATRRMEAFNAMTQIATQEKGFMGIAGDLYFRTADFPEADVLAERYRRTIPPNILGDSPNPQQEQLMHQASDKIQQLTAIVGDTTKKLADKERELDIKQQELDLEKKRVAVEQQRLDYEAETKRVVALGNSGPGISQEQIQPVLKELLAGMVQNGELVFKAPGPHEGGTPNALPEPAEGGKANGKAALPKQPPIPGATFAPDGHHYIDIPGRGLHRVEA